MSKIWQNAGTFRIRREAPHASAPGENITPAQTDMKRARIRKADQRKSSRL
jgi:hypothetical protein